MFGDDYVISKFNRCFIHLESVSLTKFASIIVSLQHGWVVLRDNFNYRGYTLNLKLS